MSDELKARYIRALEAGRGIRFSKILLEVSDKTLKEWKTDLEFMEIYNKAKKKSLKKRRT